MFWSPPTCAWTAKHCESPRRMWPRSIRRLPTLARPCEFGCARLPRFLTFAICWDARDEARDGSFWCLDLAPRRAWRLRFPVDFNVTPRLAQALKVVPGVDQVEEL